VRKPVAREGRDGRLDANEEARLRKAIESYSNPMLGWIFTIALETGMRSSEITGLRLRQVDLTRRVARLALTKNDGARTVPLTKRAAVALSAALAGIAAGMGREATAVAATGVALGVLALEGPLRRLPLRGRRSDGAGPGRCRRPRRRAHSIRHASSNVRRGLRANSFAGSPRPRVASTSRA